MTTNNKSFFYTSYIHLYTQPFSQEQTYRQTSPRTPKLVEKRKKNLLASRYAATIAFNTLFCNNVNYNLGHIKTLENKRKLLQDFKSNTHFVYICVHTYTYTDTYVEKNLFQLSKKITKKFF